MIKRRNVFMVVILWLITLGLYGLVWLYSTSDEVIRYNKQNQNPFVWIILALVPPLNVIVIWWHSQAVATMSASGGGKGINAVLLFILWFPWFPIIPTLGAIISQVQLNKRAGTAQASS